MKTKTILLCLLASGSISMTTNLTTHANPKIKLMNTKTHLNNRRLEIMQKVNSIKRHYHLSKNQQAVLMALIETRQNHFYPNHKNLNPNYLVYRDTPSLSQPTKNFKTYIQRAYAQDGGFHDFFQYLHHGNLKIVTEFVYTDVVLGHTPTHQTKLYQVAKQYRNLIK